MKENKICSCHYKRSKIAVLKMTVYACLRGERQCPYYECLLFFVSSFSASLVPVFFCFCFWNPLETTKWRVSMCMSVLEIESVCDKVCVCVWKRESEFLGLCVLEKKILVKERERMCARTCVCVHKCLCVCMCCWQRLWKTCPSVGVVPLLKTLPAKYITYPLRILAKIMVKK